MRLESFQPQLYLFAPAPTFFSDCPFVPDERMLSFVNTEKSNIPFSSINPVPFINPVQFDIVPFVDAVADFLVGAPSDVLNFLQGVFGININVPSLTDAFVGSYNGPFVVLSPDVATEASYVESRDLLLSGPIGLDVMDIQDVLADTAFALFSTHNMDEYERKVNAIIDLVGTFNVVGFGPGSPCNPNVDLNEYYCEDFCLEQGVCTGFQEG